MEVFPARSDSVACTLAPADLQDVAAAWQKLLHHALVSREEVPGGLRLVVRPDSTNALRQLINIERECCRWITFELEGSKVTMTAAGAGEVAIRDMWASAK